MKVLVFTAGFYDRDYDEKLRRLSATAKKFSIPLSVYGRKEFFSFFDSKIVKMLQFLESKQNDYTHVLYTDAQDTFFLSNLAEICEKYHKLGGPLILSAEKFCYPTLDFIPDFPDSPTAYRFFNAGGYMGEIQHVIDTLRAMQGYSDIDNNDNAHWMHAFHDGKISFKIDYWCDLFQTMSDTAFGKDKEVYYVTDKITRKPRVINRKTNSLPSIIHFNGPKGPGTINDKLMTEVFDTCW